MKKILSYSLLFILIATIASCHDQIKKPLGSDYYLMGVKDDSVTIKLAHGVNDHFDDIVLGEIIDFVADGEFILIHRKVSDRARIIFEENPLWLKQVSPKDQYWIVEKKYDGVTGPLTKEEYLVKRKQLQISDGVKIRQ